MMNGRWGKQDTIKKTSITIQHKPVVNYKQITQADISWPITKKFLTDNIDTSIQIALPLVTEVSLKEGLLEIFIRTSEDQENQREKPVLYMRVKPYTTNYYLMSPSRVLILNPEMPRVSDRPTLVW